MMFFGTKKLKSYKNNKNIVLGILTFIWVIWIGYWAHYLAHNDTFLNYFSAEDNIFSFNDPLQEP